MDDLRKHFGTDAKIEQQGIDVHIVGSAYVTVARAGGANKKFEVEKQRAFRKHRRALAADAMSNEEAETVWQEIYARTVVLGWRGVALDGEELQFSYENCLRLFRELPKVWDIIKEVADQFANYRSEEIDAAGKV